MNISNKTNKKSLPKILNGNEAFSYGMIKAGLKFFAGYPITPSTDVLEILSYELEKYDGVFIQAESEISAINMVFGASSIGARATIATSGCGFSLMQEAISYMASDDIPCVILNVMREGAGLGDIPPSQGDYFQMTKGGGNGDYHTIVLAPNSVEECYHFPEIAFNLAEKYLLPIIVTYDSDIAHTKENICNINIEDFSQMNKKNLHHSFQNNLYAQPSNIINGKHKVQNTYYHMKDSYDEYLLNKYKQIETNEQKYEEYFTDDAEIIIVAYGICSRVALEVVNILRNKNLKIGLIRPITLYPFPVNAFNNLSNVKKIYSLEMDILGQMAYDIQLATNSKCPIEKIGKMSSIKTASEIAIYINNERNLYV